MLALAACGAPDQAAGPAPAATATAATTPSEAVASAEAASTKVKAPKPAKIEVPRGVGLDYQSAQDLWRAAGLHVAPAKDVTGANRIPVIDSNWIVVSQDPKAGSTVAEGSFITATVKKDSDD
ncbi:PASTA domain-containing protein [Actinoplanes sp. NPDC051346]|uniref:PASTA domain-containing protein n=1 Tax=Actinoplanes sp. NPDC051346 TaxID=3155048 RepID=UPI00342EB09A